MAWLPEGRSAFTAKAGGARKLYKARFTAARATYRQEVNAP